MDSAPSGDDTQGGSSVPLMAPAEVDRRLAVRAAAVKFMEKPPTERERIAELLGLSMDGLDDLRGPQAGIEILRRVRAAGKVDELMEVLSGT